MQIAPNYTAETDTNSTRKRIAIRRRELLLTASKSIVPDAQKGPNPCSKHAGSDAHLSTRKARFQRTKRDVFGA
jgi:hypothetical protein